MPREQAPDQQYQKGLNPDNLITDEEDTEDSEDTEFENTETPPAEGEQRLAQHERQQRPDGDINQVEEEDGEKEADEDESDDISQRS